MMKTSVQKYATVAVLTMAAVIYYLYISHVPYCYDDWNFREMYQRVSGGSLDFSFGRIVDYVSLVRFENDGRLSNIADMLVQFAPRWLYDVIFAVAVTGWLWLSSRLTGVRIDHTLLSVVVIWSMYVLFLPWRDGIMSCVDFSLNYVIASALTLSFIWLWQSDSRSSGVGVLSVAVALIAGCWHEGFSVSLAGGLVSFYLFNYRRRIPAKQVAMSVMLVFGIIIALSSTGLQRRMGDQRLIVVGVSYILRDMMPVLLAGIVMAVMMLKSAGRQLLLQLSRDTLLILWVGAMLTGTAIALHTGHTPRVAWCADMFAVLTLGTLMKSLRVNDRVATWSAIALTVVLVAFYSGVISWQMRTERDYDAILVEFDQSTDGTIVYDYSAATPLYTLHHPSRFQLVDTVIAPYLQGIDERGRVLRFHRFNNEVQKSSF